ncbi:hypothetical protein BH10BDE1_BH10BDE1_18140 [soil metagenome]
MFKKISIHAFALAMAFVFAAPLASAVTLSKQIGYYGDDFFREVAAGSKDKDLILSIRKVLESRHLRTRGGMDTVGANCDTAKTECYQHKSVGYSTARKILMGQLFLQGTASSYSVRDVYCERDFTSADVGPGKIPASAALNTEHTWPQSRFSGAMGKDTQKSDLHHLYPTDSEMNGVRGNHKFGEVSVPGKALKCASVKIGTATGGGEEIFEPPTSHKGNVARSLFYFSIRYKIAIDPKEEAFLKAWNRLDPVDQAERDRNEAILKIQGDRNPFVDYPELADEIADF